MLRPLLTVDARLATLEVQLCKIRQRIDAAAHAGFMHARKRFAAENPDHDFVGEFAFRLAQARSKVAELELLAVTLLETCHAMSSSKLTARVAVAEGSVASLETLVEEAVK